jgi:hypothetical protein
VTEAYDWAAGREFMLRTGAECPAQILILQPLFEESNRTRRIIVQVMRALAGHEIGCILPDLPGTGESPALLADTSIANWQDAIAACAGQTNAQFIASFRGGALFDHAAPAKGYWRCAPETGQRIVRDLKRAARASGEESDEGSHFRLAGNRLNKAMVEAIDLLSPIMSANVRTVRLESDVAEANGRIAGTPVWRRSEPGDDDALRDAIVADLQAWVAQCATS